MTALTLRGVTKTYPGVLALDAVDLDVAPGELVAVLGPSGCGKTTLLRCVAGFERVDAGRITLADKVVSLGALHLPAQRRGVGIVPQEGALFPHLSVADNVAFGLNRGWLHRRPSPRTDTVVAGLLDLVGLGGLGARHPHELSGGQQQRVALARALAPNPAIVLLDEPFSALDAGLRTELRRDVRRVLAERGTTALLVTHDQGEALSMADRVAVMNRGRVVQTGTPEELYTRPVDAWVAEFVGDASWLAGSLAGDEFACALGRLHVRGQRPAGPARALIRPEQITIGTAGVPAQVQRVDFHGHDAMVALRLGDGALVWSRLAQPVQLPAVGQAVGVRAFGEALLVEPVTTAAAALPQLAQAGQQ